MSSHSIALAGASGVVGSRVLEDLLQRDDVGHVTAVGRRTLSLNHDKLASQAVDMQNRTSIAAAIPAGIAVAFCCLGTTMRQAGSQQAFRAVDHDAVIAFAQAALDQGARGFLLVSSAGASASARNFYLRTKGEAEQALARLGFAQLTILRPSLIDDRGARREYRLGERLTLPLARAIFSVVGKTSRYAPISADTIARAMVRLAFDPAGGRMRIVESDELHALGRQTVATVEGQ